MKKLLDSWFLPLIALLAMEMPAVKGQQPAEKDLTSYLFAYFTGDRIQGEAIRFAVSPDGYSYYALNGNEPVIESARISSTGGVRDPHILRSEDGKTFYMVATDMTSSKGWDSNRAMVLLKSGDLVSWSSTVINIQEQYPGNEDLKRVWAPQTIFDPAKGKYMVYWSMKHGNGPDIIYYAYANDSFTGFTGKPEKFFLPSDGKSCIDGDIVLKDSVYHLFYKTEGNGDGIRLATTASLASGRWTEHEGYKQQTREAVEGSSVFRLANRDEYILMYDVYKKGKYQFTGSNDLQNFRVIDQQVSMNFHPRHGTVLPITRQELKNLFGRWGVPSGYPPPDNNPILAGYYADPEILYSKKTNKYYLYPTSDGFENWTGDYFKVFSSENLTDWKDDGVILDLKRDVKWANRNAWAPCIVEKKIRKKYRYFYYFTAAQTIGVAVADHPAGPFRDSGRPLIGQKPDGITGGQVIDPDVFTDPKTGKSYLYWGNGFLAGAELNDDMVSVNDKSLKIMTPDKTFREGTYVFYRNGTYYFMWSEDDTRSPGYKVRYATSDSPLGKLTIPKDNIVVRQNPDLGIYATGHNSVLQIPGRDEWYLVYHRFDRPNGIKMGRSAGYHREVCIDRLDFDAAGNIREVIPTLQGIQAVPVVLTGSVQDGKN